MDTMDKLSGIHNDLKKNTYSNLYQIWKLKTLFGSPSLLNQFCLLLKSFKWFIVTPFSKSHIYKTREMFGYVLTSYIAWEL